MNSEFNLDRWLKSSLNLVIENFKEWILYSISYSIVLSLVSFYTLKFMTEKVIAFVAKLNTNLEIADYLISFITNFGLFILLAIVIQIILSCIYESFVVKRTSSWIEKNSEGIEKSFSTSLASVPTILFVTILNIALSILAFTFCIIPYFLMNTFFLFLIQLIVIEKKSVDAFERSFQLTKKHFWILFLVPIVITLLFQFANTAPVYLFQFIIAFIIPNDINLETLKMENILAYINSPYTILAMLPFSFIISLQICIKSILYTNAYYEVKEK